METNATKNHMVCWLPWFRIANSIKIGEITFIRYERGRAIPGCDDELARELSELAKRFIDIHGNSLQTMCIAVWRDNLTFPVLGHSEMRPVIEAANLLMLAYHAKNEYLTQGGHYANASMFQLVMQKFEAGSKYTAVVTRGRDGPRSDLGFTRSEIKDQAPRAIRTCGSLREPGTEFLEALDKVAGKKASHHRKILNSLFFFGLANTDDTNTRLDMEVVLLEWSIDHLLGPFSGNRNYQMGIMNSLRRYAKITVSHSTRLKGGVSRKAEEENWLLLQQWAYEHYLLRNNITHGEDWRSMQWRWDISEHCLFAAWVYPLLVKLVLMGHREYTLTTADEACLASIDAVLASPDWGSDWDRIIRENKWTIDSQRDTNKFLAEHPDVLKKLQDAIDQAGATDGS